MKNIGIAGLTTLMCLAFAAPVMAQGQAQPSPAEVACNAKYTKYYGKQDDMPLFNDFVNDATCKDSQYRVGAYQLMAQSLAKANKAKELVDFAGRFAKEMPNADANAKGFVFTNALNAANQLGDADKMIDLGEKVLALNPNDLQATVTVSTTLIEALPTDSAAKDKAMDRAVELAKKLIAMMKPQQLADQVWKTSVQAPAHGVIGFVHLQRKAYQEALTELMEATTLDPKGQLYWYRAGLASFQLTLTAQKAVTEAYDVVNANRTPGPERDAAIEKRDAVEKEFREIRDKTVDILVTAVALPDPEIAKAARSTLEIVYKPAHNNTIEGLDELIAAKKAQLK